jgi:hypothetical protein
MNRADVELVSEVERTVLASNIRRQSDVSQVHNICSTMAWLFP